ncbi:GILT-like protein 1 [Hetaerina americana]|uniref:GILT-like protein 1 n=1 Tax=Hetaerina americana TaxID=62018 RepID=UPI003A7F37E4
MSAFAVLVFLALSASSVTYAQSTVHVDIYYESLCPDSMAFITKQFYPTYKKMAKYMKVNFIPYGNSNTTKDEVTGVLSFVCQHGPDECFGNKVQSCALAHLTDEMKKVEFVNCMMTRKNSSGLECATEINASFDPIQMCINGVEGNTTLAKMGEKTKALMPPLTSVPTVVFDMKYKMEEQKMITSDFMMALCSRITTNKPTECSGKSGATYAAQAAPSIVFALAALLPVAAFH